MEYSVVKGLAEILLLRELERTVVQLMALKFTQLSIPIPRHVYMDETEKDDVIGVAGLIGTFENWIGLEDRWRKALPKEADNDFHYTDFWARRSYGADWSEEKRLWHTKELAQIIGNCTVGAVGFVFLKSMYEKLVPKKDKKQLISPLHFCMAQCLAGIVNFYENISQPPPKPLHIMFDQKREAKASIAEVYLAVKERYEKEGVLGTFSYGARKDYPPLQAVDFLVGELRRKQEGHESVLLPLLSKKHPLFYAFPTEEEFATHVREVQKRLAKKGR